MDESDLEAFQQALMTSVNLLPDTRSEEHQLIVLGNGFDLACNLPSSYYDFFGRMNPYLYPNVDELKNHSWGEYLRILGFTTWDIILCDMHRNTNWYDVEKCIGSWVTGKEGHRHLERILAFLNGKDLDKKSLPKNWRQYTGKPRTGCPEADVARYIADTWPDVSTWNRTKFLSIMFEELRTLESRFAKYLRRAVSDTKGYSELAAELLRRIVEDRTFPDDSLYRTTVLNFNYTMPYHHDANPAYDGYEFVNIHGYAEHDEAVFGIDGTDCMDDRKARPFTKTHRIMGMGMDDVCDIVFPPDSLYGITTRTIKFFGHSLSKPDYAYFQALFDVVDLYSGSTTLIFYYRPFGDADEDPDVQRARCRRKKMDEVISLLISYGKTLDNKGHGKNLIHRLLLEGRLHVLEI